MRVSSLLSTEHNQRPVVAATALIETWARPFARVTKPRHSREGGKPAWRGWSWTGGFAGITTVSLVLLLAQAIGLGVLPGCGVQGPPQPPRVEVPGRITDLTLEQVGRKLEIHFTLPQQAQDGERLTKPLEVEILRAQIPPGLKEPKSSPLAVWIWLQPAQWAAYTKDRSVSYPAGLSEDEFKNWQAADSLIAIRTLTRGFRHRPVESEVSNLVRLRVLEVSGPVEHIESKTTEKAIEVSWVRPAKTLAGEAVKWLAGYRVYRSSTEKPGSFQLVGESQAPPYLDHDFEFGHAYFYEVAAVFKENGTTAESDASQPYEVIPRDIFPPARPTGLTALYANGAVELVWTANTEKDLAGYYVYRRENGDQPRRLNKELLRTPILRDASVQSGHTYFYQVTAVDLSGNESQPCEEAEVETRN
jgi:hypothetical protein